MGTNVVTEFVEADGVSYAYRRFGEPGGVPLVLLQHFRGNLDNWDPAVTDALAAGREVITVDAPGVGASTGAPKHTRPRPRGRSSPSRTLWACGQSTCLGSRSEDSSPRTSR